MDTPQTFTRIQIILHWTVAALVAYQFLFPDSIEQAWRAFRRGTYAASDFDNLALAHLVVGVLVLVLVAWRLALRLRYGAPAADPAEPAALQMLSKAAHYALYGLLVVLPLSGLIGWFYGAAASIQIHLVAKTILLPLIGLHALGALVHHFYWRTDVLKRMLGVA
ncbi:cytochrome b [Escherichia coli]|nr:cytochrome b [Escherichia coli]